MDNLFIKFKLCVKLPEFTSNNKYIEYNMLQEYKEKNINAEHKEYKAIDKFTIKFYEFMYNLNNKYVGCDVLEEFNNIFTEIYNVFPESKVYKVHISDIVPCDTNIYNWIIRYDDNNNIVNIKNG